MGKRQPTRPRTLWVLYATACRSASSFDPHERDIQALQNLASSERPAPMSDLIYLAVGVAPLLIFALYVLGLKRI